MKSGALRATRIGPARAKLSGRVAIGPGLRSLDPEVAVTCSIVQQDNFKREILVAGFSYNY
jgi:hypothetical protein